MKKIIIITAILCILTFVCSCTTNEKGESQTTNVIQSDTQPVSEVKQQNNSPKDIPDSQNGGEINGGFASMEQFAQSKEVTDIIDEFNQNNTDIDFVTSVEENGSRLVCTAQYNNSSLNGDDGVKIYRVMEPLIQQAWKETGGVPSLNTPEFELYCYSDDGRLVYDHLADLGETEAD